MGGDFIDEQFYALLQKTYPEALKSLLSDQAHLFTFYQFEAKWHKFMRTTNAIESLFNNVRTRTDAMEVFTTEQSCLTIVWAAMVFLPKLARVSVPVGYSDMERMPEYKQYSIDKAVTLGQLGRNDVVCVPVRGSRIDQSA